MWMQIFVLLQFNMLKRCLKMLIVENRALATRIFINNEAVSRLWKCCKSTFLLCCLILFYTGQQKKTLFFTNISIFLYFLEQICVLNRILPSNSPSTIQFSRNYMLKFGKLQHFAIHGYIDSWYVYLFERILYQKCIKLKWLFSYIQLFVALLLILKKKRVFT